MNSDIFEIFDIDKDGHITFSEFKKIWGNIGIKRNDDELLDIFNIIDLDKNGTIEKHEFRKYINEEINMKDVDSVNEAFHIIDKNNDQSISFFEIEKIIHKLNIDISLAHIKTCFYDYTYDLNEQINLKKFMELLIKSNTHKSIFKTITNLLEFIDQSETNKIIKNTTQIKRKELLQNYRWLRNISPFTLIGRSRIYALIENMKCFNVSYNNHIFHYGDEINYIFIVYYGTVKITKNNKELSTLSTGSILCLDDIIKNKYYQYSTITTSNNSVIWKIPIQDFRNVLYLEDSFRNLIYKLGSSTLKIRKKIEYDKDDFINRVNKQYKQKEDVFRNIRGFNRWLDPYPIKINPDNYKLRQPIKKDKKEDKLPPIKEKSTMIHKVHKFRKKSYSKIGKSLDIVFNY